MGWLGGWVGRVHGGSVGTPKYKGVLFLFVITSVLVVNIVGVRGLDGNTQCNTKESRLLLPSCLVGMLLEAFREI